MTEREQFEDWYLDRFAREPMPSGYESGIAWEAWQAARATAPEGMAIVPVETQKDAERYRFIRNKIGYDRYGVTLPCGNTKSRPEETDAAIDAAMLAATKEKGEGI